MAGGRALLCLLLLLSLGAAAQAPQSFPSPDGRYRLEIASEEVKMSHWIDQATVLDPSGQKLWSSEFPWSLTSHHWGKGGALELELRKYPGDRPPVRVRLQLDSGTFDGAGGAGRPLGDLNGYLESCLRATTP
jgi:hypothetical protein